MIRVNSQNRTQTDRRNNIKSPADFISSAGHIIGSVCCFPDVLTNIITSYIDITPTHNADLDVWHISRYDAIDDDIDLYNYRVYYTYLLNSSMLILGFAHKSQYGHLTYNIVCLFDLQYNNITFIRYGYITMCSKISDDCIIMRFNQSNHVYKLIHRNLYLDHKINMVAPMPCVDETISVQGNYPISKAKKFVDKYIVGISNRTLLIILDPYDMKVLVSVDNFYAIIDYHIFNNTSIMCCFENGHVKNICFDYTC